MLDTLVYLLILAGVFLPFLLLFAAIAARDQRMYLRWAAEVWEELSFDERTPYYFWAWSTYPGTRDEEEVDPMILQRIARELEEETIAELRWKGYPLRRHNGTMN